MRELFEAVTSPLPLFHRATVPASPSLSDGDSDLAAAAWHETLYGADGWLADLLEGERGLWLRVRGTCMEPRLLDGQRVRVEPSRHYLPGDVIAVCRGDSSGLLMHRYLGPVRLRRGWKFMTMADSASRPDPLASGAQVLGRVVACGDRRHRVPARLRVFAAAVWIRWSLRFLLRKVGRRLSMMPRRTATASATEGA